MKSSPQELSVLLVDDETLTRMTITGMAEELGHTVVAEAGNINDALTLARIADFKIAVLEVDVGGERIEPVAEIVADRQLPLIFASGYGPAGVPQKFRDRPILQKPFSIDRLQKAIEEAFQESGKRNR